MDLKTCITGLYTIAYPVLNPKPDRRVRGNHWLSSTGMPKGTSMRVSVESAEEWADHYDVPIDTVREAGFLRSITLELPGSYGSERQVIKVFANKPPEAYGVEGDRARYVHAIVESLELRTDALGMLHQRTDVKHFPWDDVLLRLIDDGVLSVEKVVGTRDRLHEEWERADKEREERNRLARAAEIGSASS